MSGSRLENAKNYLILYVVLDYSLQAGDNVMEAPTEFLQLEYEALRTEMIQLIADARSLERYVATGCAAVWAWVAVHPESPKIALYLPVLLAVLGGIRDRTFGLEITALGDYLRKIEAHYLPQDSEPTKPLGWEYHNATREVVAAEMPYLLWFVLFAGGLLAIWQLPTGRKPVLPLSPTNVPCVVVPSAANLNSPTGLPPNPPANASSGSPVSSGTRETHK